MLQVHEAKALDPHIVAEFRNIVGDAGLISEHSQLLTYETDGLTTYRQCPSLVLLPTTTEQVQGVVRVCHREGIPFVPRGSGTGLSGGAMPAPDSVVIGLSRMRDILDIDIPNQRAVVQPGVLNLWITGKVAEHGYYYAPDPSSQVVCSIGGNVAENSGGAHCLKYGFTVNHVLGMTAVLPDGEVVHLGGQTLDTPGYDLTGIVVGSEGTLAVVTEVIIRLTRKPEAVKTTLVSFESTDAAGEAVSGVIGAGIVPSAIEMMDKLAIEAAEAAVHAGYPLDVGALLLVELDGPQSEVEQQQQQVEDICRQASAIEIRLARSDEQRMLFWKGRKAAFAAMGRISPNYIVQDGVIPRTALSEILREIEELGREYGLRVANVFHAGDGNLHPLVCYDDRDEGAAEKAEELAGAIIRRCVAHGGSITGEHGVGIDKMVHMPSMFSDNDMQTHQRVRCAFNPTNLCNPGKVYPTPRLCGEVPGKYRPHPLETAGIAERF